MRPTLGRRCLILAFPLCYGVSLLAGCGPTFHITGCTSCHQRQEETPSTRHSCNACHEENERCKEKAQAIGALPGEEPCVHCHDSELDRLSSSPTALPGAGTDARGKQQLPFAPAYRHNTGQRAVGCGPCHDGATSPSTVKD